MAYITVGWFLHHTPALVLSTQAKHNDGLRRAWYWACREDAINPHAPTHLPLLFALDAKLAIEYGYHYTADCHAIGRMSDAGRDATGAVYCGTSFSDSSYSGSADSFGGMDSSDCSSDGGSSDGGSSDGGGGCSGRSCD